MKKTDKFAKKELITGLRKNKWFRWTILLLPFLVFSFGLFPALESINPISSIIDNSSLGFFGILFVIALVNGLLTYTLMGFKKYFWIGFWNVIVSWLIYLLRLIVWLSWNGYGI